MNVYQLHQHLASIALFLLLSSYTFGQLGVPTVISFDDPSMMPSSCFTIFTEEGVPQQLVDNTGSCFFDYSTANGGELWLFPATLSVDLTGFSGIERVEIDINDFCGIGCSQASLNFNSMPVINTANTMVGSQEMLIMDNPDMVQIDELTMSSFEGLFLEIRIFSSTIIDPCMGTGDSDNDNICDALDTCPGFDDNIDRDGNGIPDYCDICETDRNMMESSQSGDMLTYEAVNQISSAQMINSGAMVTFNAGIMVELSSGFEVHPGATFSGLTGEGCSQ